MESYVLTEYKLPGTGGKGVPPVAIALVSDLHEQDPAPVLTLLQRARPDLICVTGDTFERHDHGIDPRKRKERSKWKRYLWNAAGVLGEMVYRIAGNRQKGETGHSYRFLREAGKLAPVFLSLGNHEWYLTDEDRRVIAEAGATLLDNADCVWKGMRIGGLSTGADEEWLEGYRKKDGFKLLLCHHPEYYERFGLQDIDLVLSGHVHGGQWRIKGRGLFAPDQGILPKYAHGVYGAQSGGKMIVSAGCANTTAFPRFGNPCEVVLIRLGEREMPGP